MSHAINGLVFAFRKNLDYAPKLVADLTNAQMAAQPAINPDLPTNHAAWVLSHLNVYLPIIECLIKGKSFVDPLDHRFGKSSRPESDPTLYASKQELVDEFVRGHQRIIELLEKSDDSVLGKPVLLARWQPTMPFTGIVLPYLMLNHENCHLGQLSAWRRVQGLPSV